MYYVTMIDTFMSGWGMAEDKTNRLVISCETYDEAKIVQRNAHHRSDVVGAEILSSKPSYPSISYYTSWHDRSSYPAWFSINAFVNR